MSKRTRKLRDIYSESKRQKTLNNEINMENDIKNIILEELRSIKTMVYNDNIKYTDNKISKIYIETNNNEYHIPYDEYVKYTIATDQKLKLKLNNDTFTIMELYDNSVIQNIYKIVSNVNNCKSFRVKFDTENNNGVFSDYTRSKMMSFNKSNENYDLYNNFSITNMLLPNILECNTNTIIMNVGIKDKDEPIDHRNLMIFKKNETRDNIIFNIYIYEPHGSSYIRPIYKNFVEELNFRAKKYREINKNTKNISFYLHIPYFEKCPIGIQSALKKVDTGLCVIYSYFWCYLFIKCVTNKKFIDNNYDINKLTELLESDLITSLIKIMDNDKVSTVYKLFVEFGYYTIDEWLKQTINTDIFFYKLMPQTLLNTYKINNVENNI